MTTPVLIIGAGVAGLATALAMARRGIAVHVLERRPSLAVEGAGIQIGPNGTRVLADLGVLDAVRPAASVPSCIAVHHGRDGRLLTELPLGDWIARRHASPYWVVHRLDLVRALLDACTSEGVTVSFSADLRAVASTAQGVVATLADGTEIRSASLIGADGLWSQVRSSFFDGQTWNDTGLVATRCMIEQPDTVSGIRRDAVSVWMAPDAHLVAYPIRAGAALNIVLITHGQAPLGRWSSAVNRDVVHRRLAGDHAPARFADRLIALAEVDADWRQWPFVRRPALSSYASGNVCLVGDAAHPMLPFLAQGGVMALEDALVVADALARHTSDPAQAFAAYSAARLTRTQRVVEAARQNGHIYHLDGIAGRMRNAALATLPGAAVMRRYDWLYGGGPARGGHVH